MTSREAEVAGGSNNWALGPQKTATGRPLLAGDPHRVLEMPSMYYQAHLACGDFDVIGLTVPGAPGFPNFGHNGKVAWCVTHAFVDIHDLYVERFDAKVENISFKGGWKPVTHRAETIAVRGEADVVIDVVETMHGPSSPAIPPQAPAWCCARCNSRCPTPRSTARCRCCDPRPSKSFTTRAANGA